ncbi:hypothetical protein OHB41_25925 [Streptomyces sp. NBC_01571]|uniref:hypothetical protein n=1 Tax=Streptomyces sp. NBC_01571 TaxID=2975883 RepID=UPI0022545E4C|nr:hypothetical protein [Streptomyces sp. NBC_01571]MCX4576550.1 hypothetical protein [Streptomyces sp. NBC_01571]
MDVNACELCGETAGGRYLCERHTVQLALRLTTLPVLDGELALHLVPARTGFGEPVTGRGAGPRSPINESVLDLMEANRAAKVVHARRVDVQRARWPEHSAPPPSGLAADCRWLGMELEWIVSSYPAAGEMARELHELERELRSLGADTGPAREGLCVAVTDDAGTVCGAVLSRGSDRVVRCRWCGTEYRTEQDLLLLMHYQPKEASDA